MFDYYLFKRLRSFIWATIPACLLFTAAKAEMVRYADTIRVSDIKLSYRLKSSVLWYRDNTHTIKPDQISTLPFNDTIPALYYKWVPGALVEEDAFLKFNVQNTEDTVITVYFIPGYYFKTIDLYKLEPGKAGLEKIEDINNDPEGFRRIDIPPGQTLTIFALLKFIKTSINTFDPELVRDYYLSSFVASKKIDNEGGNIITFVFSGVLAMMILYSVAVAIRNRNQEFLLYALYAFCLGLMLFLKSFLFKSPSSFYYFFEAYLDFIMQSTGTFIYLAFLRRFINAKKDFPFLYKMLWVEQLYIGVSIALFSYYFFFTDNYTGQDRIENISKSVWSFGTVLFIIYAIRAKNRLLNYLATGHFLLLLGGLISLYLILSPASFRSHLPKILNNALIYYELGLACELMLFLVALAYKNQEDIVGRTKEGERLKLKNERQEFEKQLAVFSAQQDERNRISADMHDELGSGVTAIRLMSELVKTKMKVKGEISPEINKISIAANELINKMNALIWTMKSENDTLESLATYIRIYAHEFFENTAIFCVVNIPPAFSNIEISGGKRRNIFLCVKESLNNVLKHSKATKVTITFTIDDHIKITILDDGTGIDFNNLRPFSSGLSNLKKRLVSIGGDYRIENAPGKGVLTTIELRIAGSRP